MIYAGDMITTTFVWCQAELDDAISYWSRHDSFERDYKFTYFSMRGAADSESLLLTVLDAHKLTTPVKSWVDNRNINTLIKVLAPTGVIGWISDKGVKVVVRSGGKRLT